MSTEKHLSNALYVPQIHVSLFSSNSACCGMNKLGHQNVVQVIKCFRSQNIQFVDVKDFSVSLAVLENQTMFHSSEEMSIRPGQLIYFDVCETMQETPLDGCIIELFKDDFTVIVLYTLLKKNRKFLV